MSYEDLLGSMLGDKPKPKPEKGVPLHGRKIDDTYYVRAGDVADLLNINGVLPKAAALLKRAAS